jgi:hypothetical protein
MASSVSTYQLVNPFDEIIDTYLQVKDGEKVSWVKKENSWFPSLTSSRVEAKDIAKKNFNTFNFQDYTITIYANTYLQGLQRKYYGVDGKTDAEISSLFVNKLIQFYDKNLEYFEKNEIEKKAAIHKLQKLIKTFNTLSRTYKTDGKNGEANAYDGIAKALEECVSRLSSVVSDSEDELFTLSDGD